MSSYIIRTENLGQTVQKLQTVAEGVGGHLVLKPSLIDQLNQETVHLLTHTIYGHQTKGQKKEMKCFQNRETLCPENHLP